MSAPEHSSTVGAHTCVFKPAHGNIERITLDNEDYRRVLDTRKDFQLVVMCITKRDQGIPAETHHNTTQFFRIESGTVDFYINKARFRVEEDGFIVVPAGALHIVRQVGEEPLKLYTVYAGESPHKPGLVQHRHYGA